IVVDLSNDTPTISSHDCDASATEDAAYSCNVTVADADVGQIVTLVKDASDGCAWLTIGAPTDNVYPITGTPDNGDVGSCNLKIKAQDNHTTPASSAVTTITLTIANTAPTM